MSESDDVSRAQGSPGAGGDGMSNVEPGPEKLGELPAEVMRSVCQAVTSAANRLSQSQSQSVFRNNDDQKAALQLIGLAPKLVTVMQKSPAVTAPQPVECPECFLCGAPPGSHWTHDCKSLDSKFRGRLIFDYKTASIYERKDLGEPAPRLKVPIGQNIIDWMERNNVSLSQLDRMEERRELKELAERALHTANCALAEGERSGDISTQAAASCAASAIKTALNILGSTAALEADERAEQLEDARIQNSAAPDSDDTSEGSLT